MNDRLRTSTYFGLLAEFGTGELLLDDVAGKYFGLSIDQAKRRAAMNRLPVPAYRVAGQKSPWLISAAGIRCGHGPDDSARCAGTALHRRNLDLQAHPASGGRVR